MKRLTALALAFAAACAEVPAGPDPIRLEFPEMQRFEAKSPGRATRANSEIALDFVDLDGKMEFVFMNPNDPNYKPPTE